MLYQIQAPHFTAGLESTPQTATDGLTVYRTAPIIKYMMGWTIARVAQYCKQKRWRLIPL